jgi:AraC-like DNA-binding protein
MQNGEPHCGQPNFIGFESLPSPIGRVIHAALWEDSNGPLQQRTLNNYCITLTIAGVADYESPVGGTHTLRPGDLAIVFPGVPHFYGPARNHRWSEFYVDFDGPVFDLWTKSGMIDPAKPILHLEPMEYWLRRLREIVESPLRGGPEVVAIRVCQLQQFLGEAIAHHRGQLAGTESLTWLNEAKAALEKRDVDSAHSLHDIADEFSMSYETFRKRFVRLVGISPGAYRIHWAIDRAAQILIERRDIPLKQVAAMCGFCNEFYLSKQFKQILNLSPSEFRKRFVGANQPRPTGSAKD